MKIKLTYRNPIYYHFRFNNNYYMYIQLIDSDLNSNLSDNFIHGNNKIKNILSNMEYIFFKFIISLQFPL